MLDLMVAEYHARYNGMKIFQRSSGEEWQSPNDIFCLIDGPDVVVVVLALFLQGLLQREMLELLGKKAISEVRDIKTS